MKLVALALGLMFITWLLRKDVSFRGSMSRSLWVPLLWVLIYGSRPVSMWIGGRAAVGSGNELEGNSLNALIDFCLIVGAYVVLKRRKFALGNIVSNNFAFSLLFGFYILSILWCPYPFVAVKRLFREFGNLLIAMVLLTDKDPTVALKTVGVRAAQILFPLSIILIKFFPNFGRSYGQGGSATNVGVATDKNSLGAICTVFLLIVAWDLMDALRVKGKKTKFGTVLPLWLTLVFGVWALISSNSKGSLFGLIIGGSIFLSTYFPPIRKSPAFFARCCVVLVPICLVVAGIWTSVFAPILAAAGRDASFTDRTLIWQSVLAQPVNPLVGTGFFSFWSVYGLKVKDYYDRLADLPLNWIPRSAHNGYLETYLDGGLIGCLLLGTFVLWTTNRMAKRFSASDSFGRMLFAMTMAGLVMNFSEVYFFRLSVIWFALVLAAFHVPAARLVAEEQSEVNPRFRSLLNSGVAGPRLTTPAALIRARRRTLHDSY